MFKITENPFFVYIILMFHFLKVYLTLVLDGQSFDQMINTSFSRLNQLFSLLMRTNSAVLWRGSCNSFRVPP